jgi:hypothetical protein
MAARERGLVPASQEQALHGAAVSLLRNGLAAIHPRRSRLRRLLRRVAA